MEDAEVQDASGEHAWVFAHGPRSAELAAAGRAAGAEAAIVDWTGLGGALLVAPRQAEGAALDALLAEGEARPVLPVTAAAWEVLRVENNVPRFGVDFDDQNFPQEALDRGARRLVQQGVLPGAGDGVHAPGARSRQEAASYSSPSRERAACPRARRSRCPTARPSAPSRAR